MPGSRVEVLARPPRRSQASALPRAFAQLSAVLVCGRLESESGKRGAAWKLHVCWQGQGHGQGPVAQVQRRVAKASSTAPYSAWGEESRGGKLQACNCDAGVCFSRQLQATSESGSHSAWSAASTEASELQTPVREVQHSRQRLTACQWQCSDARAPETSAPAPSTACTAHTALRGPRKDLLVLCWHSTRANVIHAQADSLEERINPSFKSCFDML